MVSTHRIGRSGFGCQAFMGPPRELPAGLRVRLEDLMHKTCPEASGVIRYAGGVVGSASLDAFEPGLDACHVGGRAS